MLTINKHLQRLNLCVGDYPKLYGGELELEDICKGLIKNHSLTTLDIGYNNIGNAEAEHLANILKLNGKLTHLHLRNKYIIRHIRIIIDKSKIEDEGLKELCLALQANNTLQYIDLSKYII